MKNKKKYYKNRTVLFYFVALNKNCFYIKEFRLFPFFGVDFTLLSVRFTFCKMIVSKSVILNVFSRRNRQKITSKSKKTLSKKNNQVSRSRKRTSIEMISLLGGVWQDKTAHLDPVQDINYTFNNNERNANNYDSYYYVLLFR